MGALDPHPYPNVIAEETNFSLRKQNIPSSQLISFQIPDITARICWYFIPMHDVLDAFLTQIRQTQNLQPYRLSVVTEIC